MKINDVIVENKQQLDELTAGEVGTAVGKGVGAVAKGAGAVVGGIAGAGKAFMKGFRGGKAVVGGTDTPTANTAPNTKAAPAGAPGAKAAAPGTQPAAQAAPQAVDMKAIQDAIAKLPQNQRMSLRAIVAKKAGVK
jgi:hypothetical protein